MRPRDIVKRALPRDEREAAQRFEIVELLGERVLVSDALAPLANLAPVAGLTSDFVLCRQAG